MKKRTEMQRTLIIMLICSGIFLLCWMGWGLFLIFGTSPPWLDWLVFGALACLHIFLFGQSWWMFAVSWASGPRTFFLNPPGTWIDGMIWRIFWPLLVFLKIIKTIIFFARN